MKVLIAVTHLLGTGHLARALNLARAFQSAGWDVRVASGGMPAPQLDQGDVPLLQLPPVRSDGVDFARLLDADGHEAQPELMQDRQDMLCGALADKPDVLITELFPFGRRILSQEFLALLETARTLPVPPLICASIRDILAPPSKPAKAEKADRIIAELYDAVLVHADAAITPLELSWPVSDALRGCLHYTGFVAPPPAPPHPARTGAAEVLVSAGGGDVGRHIFRAAREAARGADHHWRLLVGGKTPDINAIAADAPANVTVEPARPDFRQMLHHAAVSVSMCGYNTALDLLQTGCPAVIVPFDAGSEVEQTLRARALARQPGFEVLSSAALTPETLSDAVIRMSATPRRAPLTTGLDGAAETVRIVTRLRAGCRS